MRRSRPNQAQQWRQTPRAPIDRGGRIRVREPVQAPRSLLHDPDFLKLWIGQSISGFGTQITIIAVPIVAAVALKVSPFEFGLLATLEFLPVVVLSLPATIAALSFFGMMWNVNAMRLRQAITPSVLRGRMNATMRFISWGTIPVGCLIGGFLGGVIGLHNTIWVGAIGAIVSCIPVAISPIGQIRTMPQTDLSGGASSDAAVDEDR